MSPFNSNSPCVVGNEFFVDNTFRLQLNSDTVESATADMRIESTVTEDIYALGYYLDFQSSTTDLLDDEGEGAYEVEIWEGTAFGSGLVTSTFLPVAGWTGGNPQFFVDGALSGYVEVLRNMTPINPVTLDGQTYQNESWVQASGGRLGEVHMVSEYLTGAFDGKQIVSLRVVCAVDQRIAAGSPAAGGQVTPMISSWGVRSPGTVYSYSGRQGSASKYKLISSEWLIDPSTGVSWMPEAVAKFEETGQEDTWFGFQFGQNGSPSRPPIVYACWLEVVARDPEKRVAEGHVTDVVPGWNKIPVQAIGGGAWAKEAGVNYFSTLRRRSGDGTAAFRVLASSATSQERVNENLSNIGVFTSFSEATKLPLSVLGDAAPFGQVLIRDEDDTLSVDSLPYAVGDGEYVPALGLDNQWSMVNVARDIRQYLTIKDDGLYGFWSVLCRVPSEYTTQNLVISLHRTSDDGIIGGPAQIRVRDLDKKKPRTAFQRISGLFSQSPIELEEDDEVYFQFTAGHANAPNVSWRVQVLSGLDPDGPGGLGYPLGDVSYGGATERYAYQFGFEPWVDVPWADVCVVLAQYPEPPDGLTAIPVSVGGNVGTPAVDLVWDAWTPPEGCPGFLYYDIDRSDDGGINWHRIAQVTDPDVTAVQDQECRVGRESLYRIRVRRLDLAISPWSDTVAATATMSDRGGYCYSSNEAPGYIVWYEDLPTRDYEFLSGETLHKLADQDFQVSIKPLEDGGVAFTAHVLVAALGGLRGTVAPSSQGPDLFAPLRLLSGAMRNPATGEKVTTSYVCVRDGDGNRWFASINVGTGIRNAPRANMYTTDVRVTQLTDRPSVFDAAGEG